MSEDQALQYLQQGIAAAKAKQNDDARRLLQNAIRLNPRNETAWLWLSSVAKDDRERVFCLRELLKINPQNDMALKGLRALGVAVTPPEGAAAAEAPLPTEVKSPIPRLTPDKVQAAQAALEPILERVLALPDPYADIVWTHKTRGRVGERAAFLYRLAVRGVPLLIVVALLAIGGLFIANNPDVIALAPTWTPSPTPTNTPTPTPGFTPTPSPTPELTYTPTPAFDARMPHGDIFTEMTPTPIYPRISSLVLEQAIALMERGQYAEVLPTLTNERQNTQFRFDPNPYLYEAIARVRSGDPERALEILEEGLAREDSPDNDAVMLAGLAYVHAALGNYSESNRYAEQAIAGDPRMRLPYLVRAQNAIAARDFDTAARVIADGLQQLPGDANLWIMQGELNLARNQPADAQWNASAALYIDPSAEAAYLLRARADMARGDDGLAVLHLQEYLFFYPGSIEGWTLLGDARAGEGNYDLAIAAYSRALNAEEPSPAQIPAYLGRAAIYLRWRQYAQAFQNFDAALRLDESNVPAREGRAEVAYRLGRFGVAIDDADALLATDNSRDDLRLLKARALVDGANPRNEEAYRQALAEAQQLLAGNFPERLPDALRPLAYEYRARVLLAQGQYDAALDDIDRALAQEESGSRHYLRGLILQERNGRNDLAAARREYEWVQMWGSVYSYPFLPDVISRLNALNEAGG